MSPVTVQKLEETPQADTNPHQPRWGFNGVVRDKVLDGTACGFGVLPYAKWFPITSYKTRREIHTTDEFKPREEEVLAPAQDAQNYLEFTLAGKNHTLKTADLGLVVEFFGEADAAKMEVISQAVLPTLSAIRDFAKEFGQPAPVLPMCPSQDDLDFDGRETCPTCWLEWLNSDLCTTYLQQVAKVGMRVREIGDGEETTRLVKPLFAELQKARQEMTNSFKRGINALQKEWADIIADLEKGDIKQPTDFQHQMRKDIHANKPAERQLETMKQMWLATREPASGAGAEVQLRTLEVLDKITQRLDRLEKGEKK